MESIAIRVEAIPSRLRVEAIAIRLAIAMVHDMLARASRSTSDGT